MQAYSHACRVVTAVKNVARPPGRSEDLFLNGFILPTNNNSLFIIGII